MTVQIKLLYKSMI